MLAQLERRAGRTGEGDGVLAGEMLEQIADAPQDQLHRAFREDAGRHDAPKHCFREVAGLGGGLDDRRHAGEQRRGELLQHPPHGEVEGVDVHRCPLERHADVLADEGAPFGERLHGAVDINVAVGELAGALAGIDEERADAAVDVDPGIVLGGPGRVGESVELLLVLAEELRERLQARGALVKGQPAQRRAADLAGMPQHQRRIQPLGACVRDHLAGARVAQRRARPAARLPPSGDEAFQLHVVHPVGTT
jgi:hypothetical protein